ncbi:GGDEF domain-containing protein [Rhodococcus qingshengii]|uniref:GGDEF domain-containing protein n=1 Tax=Rhodococcus qingshengii TaxID=334542 RepID=UPI00211E29CF|nr:GGDEF domain-containing protein [Rhodococcus qingshengii]
MLLSTGGALPLPAIALLSPAFLRAGAGPYLAAIWVSTMAIFLLTLAVGRLSDRMFSVVGLIGMAGIAASAYLVTDPLAARGIVTLLSAIPAIAAMASSRRVIVGHTIVAIALACAVAVSVAHGFAAALVSCTVSVTAIWLPVFMIGALRRSLVFTQARYRELAHTDPLTNLPNRRGFLDRIQRYHRSSAASTGQVGFLMIDVDHFKQINDLFGHSAGDQTLRSVVAAITRTASARVLLARSGGEEFVAFFAAADVNDVEALAERIRASVAESCDVTVSIGAIYCELDDHPASPDMSLGELTDVLTHRADALMYTAKAAGRNTVRYQQLPPIRVNLVHGEPSDVSRPALFEITASAIDPVH